MRRKGHFTVLLAALLASSAGAQTPAGRSSPKILNDFSTAIEGTAKAASPAVVQITVRLRALLETDEGQRAGFMTEKKASGSGVIVDSSGYVVTNAHVVDRARSIDVSVIAGQETEETEGHKHFVAKTVGVDRETDLAVLKIDAQNLPTLPFLDSDSLRQGQIVLALGSPLGLENSLTVGFVSAPVRHLRPDHPMFYIQTDAPINPGNSGGPLLDTEGRIAGINTLILSQSGGSEGIGFAIPSNVVRQVYQQLRKEGRIRRGALGVIPEDVTPTLASALGLQHHSGVILSDVAHHSAAEAAGLQPGDILLAIDGKPLKEARQLMAIMFRHSIGDEIKLDVLRKDERLQKTVTVLERTHSPEGLGDLATEDAQLIRQFGVLVLTVDDKITRILTDLRRLYGVAVAAIPTEFAGLNPGLVTGDVIYEFNGSRIESVDALRAALENKKVGDPVALLVERKGQLIYVSFELE